MSTKLDILRSVSFGQRVAEEETDVLATYFVETDQWKRLFGGEIDIIYGPKGSGKSALYSLLQAKTWELLGRNVVLIPAENPRGATAFKNITADPPISEREFVGLWKLYIAALLHNALAEYKVDSEPAKELERYLAREGLVKGSMNLSSLLQTVKGYIRSAFRPKSVESTVEIDSYSGLPKGFTGKISFNEPGSALAGETEYRSVDKLLDLANDAFLGAGIQGWVLLDRLDVAFAESSELESNALRALFRVYLDLGSLSNVNIKIFLRTDIWSRITTAGFREASHITRHLTISWNRSSLLNLVVRRSIHNEEIRVAYNTPEDLPNRSVAEQEALFFRMCPSQVDVGPNKPNTFDWLLSRTRDGSKLNAPRELIHFLNALRDVQVRRFEVGESAPEGETLFSRPAYKDALPDVSKVRLEQTLYAEYPDQKEWLEKLRGAKTSQTLETLASFWGISQEDTAARANQLAVVGFFEKRGTQQAPEYWVPFLYRDALAMVQGAAEQGDVIEERLF